MLRPPWAGRATGSSRSGTALRRSRPGARQAAGPTSTANERAYAPTHCGTLLPTWVQPFTYRSRSTTNWPVAVLASMKSGSSGTRTVTVTHTENSSPGTSDGV
jgi:hypothetical protein